MTAAWAEATAKRLYQVVEDRKALELEEKALKSEVESILGIGSHNAGPWVVTIQEVLRTSLDANLLAAALGDLATYKTTTTSVRVGVKPNPDALLKAL